MSNQSNIDALLQHRNGIREWLQDEAPYAASDQRHLDAHTPERAYWHLGYEAALTDILDLLSRAEQKAGSGGTPR